MLLAAFAMLNAQPLLSSLVDMLGSAIPVWHSLTGDSAQCAAKASSQLPCKQLNLESEPLPPPLKCMWVCMDVCMNVFVCVAPPSLSPLFNLSFMHVLSCYSLVL
eukprot:m.30175 g.30175  ORF g.30175 m.30175 type:complete len:105 (-) comp9618_c2_seq1:227-541(-)